MRETWRKVVISADCLGEQSGGRKVGNINFPHIPYPLFACSCWASSSWWDGGCSLGRLHGEGYGEVSSKLNTCSGSTAARLTLRQDVRLSGSEVIS